MSDAPRRESRVSDEKGWATNGHVNDLPAGPAAAHFERESLFLTRREGQISRLPDSRLGPSRRAAAVRSHCPRHGGRRMTDTPPVREGENAWVTLRRRKVVQWGIAYVAGAWALLQGLAFFADVFGWPYQSKRIASLLLVVGLPIALASNGWAAAPARRSASQRRSFGELFRSTRRLRSPVDDLKRRCWRYRPSSSASPGRARSTRSQAARAATFASSQANRDLPLRR